MAGSSKELFYGLAAAPPVMHDDGDRIILPYSATYLGDTEKVQPRNPSQEIPLWVSVDDVDSYGLSGVYRALIARGRLV